MTTRTYGTIVRLGDTDMELVGSTADVRGHRVGDPDGDEFGKVEELLVDTAANRVRFLEVSTGGFLGIGKDRFTIPVDAVTDITGDRVWISRLASEVSNGPSYQSLGAREGGDRRYWTDVYGYYGFSPYWDPAYRHPTFPYYDKVV